MNGRIYTLGATVRVRSQIGRGGVRAWRRRFDVIDMDAVRSREDVTGQKLGEAFWDDRPIVEGINTKWIFGFGGPLFMCGKRWV